MFLFLFFFLVLLGLNVSVAEYPPIFSAASYSLFVVAED